MNPNDHYTFAIYYEAQQEVDGPWLPYISVCADLEEAQLVYALAGPAFSADPGIRNFELVYSPKLNWQPYRG
ncbi:hypothetical protein SEA_CHANGELING_9 [Mycobacterium phage Changeling]|nr:hypothetical protein SEA_CHANGELING_9 [Mycobacterium phage Changeling]